MQLSPTSAHEGVLSERDKMFHILVWIRIFSLLFGEDQDLGDPVIVFGISVMTFGAHPTG